jgi:hypothetical protein
MCIHYFYQFEEDLQQFIIRIVEAQIALQFYIVMNTRRLIFLGRTEYLRRQLVSPISIDPLVSITDSFYSWLVLHLLMHWLPIHF